jgi:hypothetical protein
MQLHATPVVSVHGLVFLDFQSQGFQLATYNVCDAYAQGADILPTLALPLILEK